VKGKRKMKTVRVKHLDHPDDDDKTECGQEIENLPPEHISQWNWDDDDKTCLICQTKFLADIEKNWIPETPYPPTMNLGMQKIN